MAPMYPLVARGQQTLAALRALLAAGLIGEQIERRSVTRRTFCCGPSNIGLQIVHEQQTQCWHSVEQSWRFARAGWALLTPRRSSRNEDFSGCGRTRSMGWCSNAAPAQSDFESREFPDSQWGGVASRGVEFLRGHHPDRPRGALDVIRALDQATSLAPSRSTARNVLSNLLAALLDRLGRCARPDQVLIRLEQVTERTGAAASFYRTLLENDALRNLLVSTLDLGNLPAARLIRYPELLDSLLFTLPSLDQLRSRYESALANVDPEDRRNHIRRFKAIEEFKILVEAVSDGSLSDLQQRLSLLANMRGTCG